MTNIAEHIRRIAESTPDKVAIELYDGAEKIGEMRFGELERRSDFLAWGMSARGVSPNMKILFMAPPSLELYALYFAAIKLGAVPVFLPDEADCSTKLTCIMQTCAKVFVGSARQLLMKTFFSRAFCTVDISILIGKFQLFGATPIGKLKGKNEQFPIHDFASSEAAAILFSSGSTSIPKGAIYNTEMLQQQTDAKKRLFRLENDSRCFAAMPMDVIQCLCLGNTCIIQADNKETTLDTLNASNAAVAFCTYSQWMAIAEKCQVEHTAIFQLKKAIIAGNEPVLQLHDTLKRYCLPETAESYSGYGTAEIQYIAAGSGKDILKMATPPGNGMYLGETAANLQMRIIHISDDTISEWSDNLLVKPGERGELCIRTANGPCGYINRPDDFQEAIIHDGDGFWFRTGDICYKDKEDNLWYCGRLKHRLQTPAGMLCSASCESVFATMPGVRRCRLVGSGEAENQIPIMLIEPEKEAYAKLAESLDMLQQQAASFPETASIRHFLLKHQLDASYEKNAQWAAERI